MSFFGEKEYYILRDKITPFVDKLAQSRFTDPVLVDDLIKTADIHNVVRIDVFVPNERKSLVEKIIKPYSQFIELHWTTVQFDSTHVGLITLTRISKSTALRRVIQKLDLALSDVLGIGDDMNDWGFFTTLRTNWHYG